LEHRRRIRQRRHARRRAVVVATAARGASLGASRKRCAPRRAVLRVGTRCEPTLADTGEGDDVIRLVLRRRLAVASLIALWCALVAAMLGRYAWPLDLFANFRVQYTLLFLIVAIVLFALRAPVLGVVAIAGAIVGAIPIVSYMGMRTAHAAAGSVKFRVITFNTWFRNHDYAEIARFLEQMQADVVVLQERDRDDGAQRIASHLSSYPHSFIEPRPHGVVMFSRWPITSAELLPLTNGPGVLAAHVTLDWNG